MELVSNELIAAIGAVTGFLNLCDFFDFGGFCGVFCLGFSGVSKVSDSFRFSNLSSSATTVHLVVFSNSLKSLLLNRLLFALARSNALLSFESSWVLPSASASDFDGLRSDLEETFRSNSGIFSTEIDFIFEKNWHFSEIMAKFQKQVLK